MDSLKHLRNFVVAKIFLPMEGEDTREADCVVHAVDANRIEATFVSGHLPRKGLDPKRSCKVFYTAEDKNQILNCAIFSTPAADKLLLEAKQNKVFSHTREYFRVDAPMRVEYGRTPLEEEAFSLHEGVTNISGGGIRFPVGDSFGLRDKLFIRVSAGEPVELGAAFIGEVVRFHNLGRKRFVALKYLEIEQKDRDNIISFCMAVQRNELRNRVKVAALL